MGPVTRSRCWLTPKWSSSADQHRGHGKRALHQRVPYKGASTYLVFRKKDSYKHRDFDQEYLRQARARCVSCNALLLDRRRDHRPAARPAARRRIVDGLPPSAGQPDPAGAGVARSCFPGCVHTLFGGSRPVAACTQRAALGGWVRPGQMTLALPHFW